MTELETYLLNNYPKGEKVWHLMVISFLNDYHRAIADATIQEVRKYNKDASNRLFGKKLIGCALYSTFDWLRYIDKDLSKLRKNKEDTDTILNYFEVADIRSSRDGYDDLVFGAGYSKQIRESVAKMVSA